MVGTELQVPKPRSTSGDLPIPPLRAELEVRVPKSGSIEIRDPRLLTLFTVDRPSFGIAQAFDGVHGAKGLARGPLHGHTEDEIQAVANDFIGRHLLDTEAARAAQATPDRVLPPSLLGTHILAAAPVAHPDARWACHACGACCHGFVVELSPAEDARIDRRLYADLLGAEDYAEEQFVSADEPARRVLRQDPERNLACIFLLPDGRCAVHARQGGSAKPNACRVFPFTVLKVPRRPPRLGLRLNCQSLGQSFEAGPPTAAESPEIFAALAGLPVLRAPEKIQLFGRQVGFRELEVLTDEILAELALQGLSGASLAALDRRHLGGRAGKARRRYGRGLLRYVDEERSSAQLREGATYFASLERVKRGRAALEAMAAGRRPPRVAPRVEAFLRRQLANAIYLGAPLHAPDAGVGLTVLFLALEAALHALGPRGSLREANHAIDVFTAPLIETEEHLWPLLLAVAPDYTRRLLSESEMT